MHNLTWKEVLLFGFAAGFAWGLAQGIFDLTAVHFGWMSCVVKP